MNIWKSCKEDATTPVLREEDMLFEYTEAQYEAIGDIYISAIQNTAIREAFEDIEDISENVLFEAKGANREITHELKNAKLVYKKYVKEAKNYIKQGDYDKAYSCIDKARNEISAIEQKVSKLDMNGFNMIKGWILSFLIGAIENLVPSILINLGIKSKVNNILTNTTDSLSDLFDDVMSGDYDPDKSTKQFSKISGLFKKKSKLGAIGKGLYCTKVIIHAIVDIYGIVKTMSDQRKLSQALNTYRSKILAMFKSLDVCLAAAQKDILRLKKKNNK